MWVGASFFLMLASGSTTHEMLGPTQLGCLLLVGVVLYMCACVRVSLFVCLSVCLLISLEIWCSLHQISNCIWSLHLSMNPSKCKYLVASKRCSLDPPTQLLLDGKVLEEVYSYKYLGIHVVVTPSLSWKSHINQICNKTRKLIGLLFRKYSNWGDTNTLKNIYVTCIRPHLEYTCQL